MRSSRLLVFFACAALVLASGCASKKTKQEPVSQDALKGKRVALAEIDAPTESKTHIEVGILNELLEEGRFEIIDRTTVQEALVRYPDASDWQMLGQRVGADFVLAVKAQRFEVKERKGHDKVEEEDSLLTQENGESKPVVGTRYVKVKSHDGEVRLECKFFDVAAGKVAYQGLGEASERQVSRDKNFSGKMELLEALSRRAIHDFFEKMPK